LRSDSKAKVKRFRRFFCGNLIAIAKRLHVNYLAIM
jgi:hypothetical protein